jgi:hypothetical protein
MSIELQRRNLLRRVKKDGRGNIKGLAKKIRMPYPTLLSLSREKTMGTIKSWIKIERYYQKFDCADAPKEQIAVNQ